MSDPDVSMFDQHGPRRGCKWTSCGNPDGTSDCPFVREAKADDPCKHEWHQIVGYGLRFYCTHCLELRLVDEATSF